MRPWTRSPGTSRQVTTAHHAGMGRGAPRCRCGGRWPAGGRRSGRAPWSMPGTRMSATNGCSPSTSSRPRTAATGYPTRRRGAVGRGRRPRRRGSRGRDRLDRIDDLDVAGAAAEVAGQRPRDLVARRRRARGASSASAFMTMPGEQKPHCDAPRARERVGPRRADVRGEPLERDARRGLRSAPRAGRRTRPPGRRR